MTNTQTHIINAEEYEAVIAATKQSKGKPIDKRLRQDTRHTYIYSVQEWHNWHEVT